MTWIPVDEALPTEEPDWINDRGEECWFHVIKRVLVTDADDNVLIAGYSLRDKVFYGDSSIHYIKVKAWMPLPERYVKGKRKKESVWKVMDDGWFEYYYCKHCGHKQQLTNDKTPLPKICPQCYRLMTIE